MRHRGSNCRMLAQSYRLRRLTPRPGLFQHTMQQGRRVYQCPLFKVIAVGYQAITTLPPDTPPVFGFIVSKKVALRANKRNRIKRRLRNLVHQRLIRPWQQRHQEGSEHAWTQVLSGRAFIIIVHPDCAQASFELMTHAIESMCRRLA